MDPPPPTTMVAPTIKAMDSTSIHRICSGQVVTSLATALKELVENALDAGARTVEVRMREYGAECIEVIDTGGGIHERDYEGITARHATSKISRFDDIAGVGSFGFRGEALASLCEISTGLAITTRTADSAVGCRLEFDRGGALVKRTPVARAVGTTVTITGLFEPLPVRHREFMRSLRTQYARALSVLQAYALISTHARVLCSNTVTGSSGTGAGGGGAQKAGGKVQASWGNGSSSSAAAASSSQSPPGGEGGGGVEGEVVAAPPLAKGRHSVLSTSGSNDLKSSISEVLGSTFTGSLTAFSVDLSEVLEAAREGSGRGGFMGADASFSAAASPTPSPSTVSPSTASLPTSCRPSEQVKLCGYVSKAGTGVGRSNTEKQFLFLNGRPVDMPKLGKAIADTWRVFEMGHRPAFVLNLSLPPGVFDVNVSPDKRDVFLIGEAAIIGAVKDALHKLWEPSRRTFTGSGVGGGGSGSGSGSGSGMAFAGDGGGLAAPSPPPSASKKEDGKSKGRAAVEVAESKGKGEGGGGGGRGGGGKGGGDCGGRGGGG